MRPNNVEILIWNPYWLSPYVMPDGWVNWKNELYGRAYHSDKSFRFTHYHREESRDINALTSVCGDIVVVYERSSGGRYGNEQLAYRPITQNSMPRVIKKYTEDNRAFAIYRKLM